MEKSCPEKHGGYSQHTGKWTIFDILKSILGSEGWGNKTKEMYYSFLSLKMISFDFDDFFQASQPSTVKPRLTATSLLRPIFLAAWQKPPQIFL